MTPDDDVEIELVDAMTGERLSWEMATREIRLEREAERWRDGPPPAGEVHDLWVLTGQMAAELEAVRAIVDGAVTSCELGEAIAAHFGRPLPDWNTH